MKISRLKLDLIPLFLLLILRCSQGKIDDNKPHTRQKRLLWVTHDGRLALPPGTSLTIAPSLSFPFVRYPPEGFLSNMTVTLPFTIDFNKLGLTDNENPFGVFPPLLARSMGRAAGSVLADYLGSLLSHRRSKRSLNLDKSKAQKPELPDEFKYAFHGGERALLYLVSEDFLDNFGMNGHACLLRTICEVNAYKMEHFGLFGEILKLFFSPSKSPYSDLLPEYVEAELAGRGLGGPSECWPYMKDCPKSLFLVKHNHYSEEPDEHNDINHGIEEENTVTYDPSIKNM